jgi:hypothetical protein
MKKIYSLLVFFCVALANGQNPADIDPGYNNAPIAINQFYNENSILKIQAQADGIDVSNLRSGNYFIQIHSNKGISTSKFIKL